jgi:hypothetical protein
VVAAGAGGATRQGGPRAAALHASRGGLLHLNMQRNSGGCSGLFAGVQHNSEECKSPAKGAYLHRRQLIVGVVVLGWRGEAQIAEERSDEGGGLRFGRGGPR